MSKKSCISTENRHFGEINGEPGGAQFCGECGTQVAWPQLASRTWNSPATQTCTCGTSVGWCPLHGGWWQNPIITCNTAAVTA